MNPLNPIAPVVLHTLLASTEERKHALAAHVKYHIGGGRVRAVSGKHIGSLATKWSPARGEQAKPHKRRHSRLATGHARMSPARRRESLTRATLTAF